VIKRRVYQELFDKSNPFGFEGLTIIRLVAKSKELNDNKRQAIVVLASEMCEAGRILHYLKTISLPPPNTILFVGYCSQNTLGWKIREDYEEVSVFG